MINHQQFFASRSQVGGCGPSISGRRTKLDNLLALSDLAKLGRACPLYPGTSDLNSFRDIERVVDLNAEISNCTFDLRVPKE
jgi:hypothetical protein